MKYLNVRGKKEKIPAFPHHKEWVYRCYRFFEVKSLISFLTVDGVMFVPQRLLLNRKYKTVTPRLLLIDPTSRCNLKCIGCWSADYKINSDLSYEKLDELFADAHRLGVRQIIMSGGEPLLRKDDILRLCEKHNNITYGLFTNGTLIDEKFVKEMTRLQNLNVFVSIEGFREQTDFRRGAGTYDRVIASMDLLEKHNIGYAFSMCYHSKNFKAVTSDEYLDFLREKGAWFGWMFNYIPIGKDADMSLCCTAEQRAYVKEKIEAYSRKHRFLIIDFPNSGHKSIGCVAACNDFAHINSNGDLEPCAFCHYSDSNVNEMPLLEAIRSPFFKNFRRYKPFSRNLLRPCPMMDVPDAFLEATAIPGVKSTHLRHPETPEELVEKTRPLAEKWKPVAEKLLEETPEDEKRRFGILTKVMYWGNGQVKKW